MYKMKMLSDRRAVWRRLRHKMKNWHVSDKKMEYIIENKPTQYDWIFPFSGTANDLIVTMLSSFMMPLYCFLCYDVLFAFGSKEEQLYVIMLSMAVSGAIFFGRYFRGCYKKKKWMDSLDHYPPTTEDIMLKAKLHKV